MTSDDKLLFVSEEAASAITVIDLRSGPLQVGNGGRGRRSGADSNRFAGRDSAQSLTLLDAAKIQANFGAAMGNIPAGAFPRELRVSWGASTPSGRDRAAVIARP